MEQSCLIGDSVRDVGAARAVGIDCYGVRTGYGCRDCPADLKPAGLFDDVLDAVQHALAVRATGPTKQSAGNVG
jgi:phosphoglycolate phosphatase-like HAD superfamily hydrolase